MVDDGNVALIELPNHTTKFGYYRKLLLGLGWAYEYDAKGRILSKKRIAETSFDEKNLPGWTSF